MIGELLEVLHDWNLTPSLADLSTLKDKGEYTEETLEEGNFITKRVHYKSYDGKTEIHRESTTTKNAQKLQRVSELKQKINTLASLGKFEEAIPLRDELLNLKAELKTNEAQEGKKSTKNLT